MSTPTLFDTETPGGAARPADETHVTNGVPASTSRPIVLGVDLSLAATGVARSGATPCYDTIKPDDRRSHDRMDYILDQLHAWGLTRSDLVMIEGPSYGSHTGNSHERAGLWWIVTRALYRADVPYAVAPPSSVKKYATGAGNAGKDKMLLAAARAVPDFDGDNNAADAYWLAALGADHLGFAMRTMPALNRSALAGVAWPEFGDSRSAS